MKIDTTPFMTPPLAALMTALNDSGNDAYIVGGSVRDALLGRDSNDIDLSTSATPDEVKSILGTMPETFALYPTGVDHGTWTVGVGGETYEVTSYRRDVSTDGRRAVVEFSRHIADDAFRRDFTMNALYMDMLGNVYDPTDEGVDDLMARRVRFVGNADARCEEDYLRILRLFRFHATIGAGKMDREAFIAARRNSIGLHRISGERVWSELKKLLAATDPTQTLRYMEDARVLREVLRGHRPNVDRVSVVTAAERYGGYAPRWERRYAALGGVDFGIPFPASKADKRYQEMLGVLYQKGHHVARNGYMTKDHALTIDAYILNRACIQPSLCKDVNEYAAYGTSAELPVKAADLLEAGVPEGPVIGAKLREADERFADSHLSATKETLLHHIL